MKNFDAPQDDAVDVALDERDGAGETFETILTSRLNRRSVLKGAAAVSATAVTTQAGAFGSLVRSAIVRNGGDSLTFSPIDGVDNDQITLPSGYEEQVIIRWGDSLDPNVPDLDASGISAGILEQSGAAEMQAKQFGYNCDAVEFFSLRGNASNRGLLCVNHEYTIETLLFPTLLQMGDIETFVQQFPEAVAVGQANHGVSVVEVQLIDGKWEYLKDSPFNRRLTANSEMRLTGPAAGHSLLQTAADLTGTKVLGTLNNCSAGRTPWGTYLTAEENFDQYFGNYAAYEASPDADPRVIEFHRRIPLPGGTSGRAWEMVDRRFDVARHPTEPFRHGWVVEVDPFNPNSVPKKRTALGRFKHECATAIEAISGPLVVYSGDDARMEYIFKFVTRDAVSDGREDNEDLLDNGTLYAARLNDDGSGEWLPLDWDIQPVLQENFAGQAEVLINARAAADLLGATPMDRPEDVEANPVTRKVYVACTNNTRRTQEAATANFQGRELSSLPDVKNPRGPNRWGHIVEITEAFDDNASTTFEWEIFMLCGDPKAENGQFLTNLEDLALPAGQDVTYYAGYAQIEDLAPMGSPDNINFDNLGNLWIVTDGSQPLGTNNGTWAVPTYGENRGKLRQFMSGPRDCEVCGCEFTPDGQTLFLTIQHPGDGGPLTAPTSYWPDGVLTDPAAQLSAPIQPRPSLVAVRKTGRLTNRIGT